MQVCADPREPERVPRGPGEDRRSSKMDSPPPPFPPRFFYAAPLLVGTAHTHAVLLPSMPVFHRCTQSQVTGPQRGSYCSQAEVALNHHSEQWPEATPCPFFQRTLSPEIWNAPKGPPPLPHQGCTFPSGAVACLVHRSRVPRSPLVAGNHE